MASMDSYPRAAMERAMKVQDVMLEAMAKKITWAQAAEILGISDRHMRRWWERYVEEGYNGLLDRRRGKPSRRRVPMATVEKVFALYREKYFDLNVQHFHEKLQAEHGIELSYSWVKQALQGAGMVARVPKTMRVPQSFAHFANDWALDLAKTLDWTALDFQRLLRKLHPHRSRLSIFWDGDPDTVRL